MTKSPTDDELTAETRQIAHAMFGRPEDDPDTPEAESAPEGNYAPGEGYAPERRPDRADERQAIRALFGN